MRNTGRIGRLAVLVAASLLAACTSAPHPTAAPSTSGPPPGGGSVPGAPASAPAAPVLCNGRAGKTLLAGLLAELNAGRTPQVDMYFSPPLAFVRWWDPTTPQVITYMPGPTDNSVTLDGLQAHLHELAGGGFSSRLVDFTDNGYGGTAQNNDRGGWFVFDVRGHATGSAPSVDGGGKGAVDCASGRLKVLVVDEW